MAGIGGFGIAKLVFAGIQTIASISAAQSQAKAQRRAAQFRAAADRRNAEVARSAARQDAALQKRETFRRLGAIRAAAGASGITSEGSVLDILEESAANAELDNQTILHNGELRAIGFLDSAVLSDAEARNARTTGRQKVGAALLTGLASAGTTLNEAGVFDKKKPRDRFGGSTSGRERFPI